MRSPQADALAEALRRAGAEVSAFEDGALNGTPTRAGTYTVIVTGEQSGKKVTAAVTVGG